MKNYSTNSAHYYAVERAGESLSHFGVKGMKWGIRRDRKPSGEVVFISGSSKTEDKTSPYYRHKLPKGVRKSIKRSMRSNDTFVVGDAPGIDRQAQQYLQKKHYQNVEVYGPGKEIRYTANKAWKSHAIDAPEFEPMSPEWLAKKDKAMTNRATKGIAVVLDQGSKATRNNVARLTSQKKAVEVYELKPRKRKHCR